MGAGGVNSGLNPNIYPSQQSAYSDIDQTAQQQIASSSGFGPSTLIDPASLANQQAALAALQAQTTGIINSIANGNYGAEPAPEGAVTAAQNVVTSINGVLNTLNPKDDAALNEIADIRASLAAVSRELNAGSSIADLLAALATLQKDVNALRLLINESQALLNDKQATYSRDDLTSARNEADKDIKAGLAALQKSKTEKADAESVANQGYVPSLLGNSVDDNFGRIMSDDGFVWVSQLQAVTDYGKDGGFKISTDAQTGAISLVSTTGSPIDKTSMDYQQAQALVNQYNPSATASKTDLDQAEADVIAGLGVMAAYDQSMSVYDKKDEVKELQAALNAILKVIDEIKNQLFAGVAEDDKEDHGDAKVFTGSNGQMSVSGMTSKELDAEGGAHLTSADLKADHAQLNAANVALQLAATFLVMSAVYADKATAAKEAAARVVQDFSHIGKSAHELQQAALDYVANSGAGTYSTMIRAQTTFVQAVNAAGEMVTKAQTIMLSQK